MRETFYLQRRCLRDLCRHTGALARVSEAAGRDVAELRLYDNDNGNLVHRALRTHARIELDLAEGALVAGYVLL